jgi:integrase
MMGSTKKNWSYSAGERGRNRVRAFEHQTTGIIQLEWYDRGRRKRLSLGHSDRRKAKIQADEVAAKLGQAETPRSDDITLQELFDIYLGEVTPTKSPRSQKHDQRAADLFRFAFGPGRKARDLSRRDWDRFVRERREGLLAPGGRQGKRPIVGERTIARDLKWLLAVLNWATLAGNGRGGLLLQRNPLRGLPIPKDESPKRPAMTKAMYDAMLAAAGEVDWRVSVALVMAHETGHRIGAIRQLRWSDIDLDTGRVRWPKISDKIGFEHETPLTPEAVEALKVARQYNPGIGDSWVFPSPKDPAKACSRHLMRDWWRRAEWKAGLEHVEGMGWHSLRRKFATELKEIPLKDLCHLGGWKNPQTVLSC